MAIKRHKPEAIVAKLRQVPTTSARINRPDGPKARHELTINMDQLVGADQANGETMLGSLVGSSGNAIENAENQPHERRQC